MLGEQGWILPGYRAPTLRSPQPRRLTGQPLGAQAGEWDACLGRMVP